LKLYYGDLTFKKESVGKMVPFFESKFKDVLEVIRENNNMTVVIEYTNTEFKHYKGESVIVAGGYIKVMDEIKRIYNEPNHVIKNVYMQLFTGKDVKELIEEE